MTDLSVLEISAGAGGQSLGLEQAGFSHELAVEIDPTRPVNDVPSDAVRRKVFERDKSMCVICGTPSKEPYNDLPEKTARLTLGHRLPGKRLTRKATVDELQAECGRCNETVRDEIFDPVTLPEGLPSIKGLKRRDKERLLQWLEAGMRTSEWSSSCMPTPGACQRMSGRRSWRSCAR
jgi:hypothetical protein